MFSFLTIYSAQALRGIQGYFSVDFYLICLEDDPKLHEASGLFLVVLAIDISRLLKQPSDRVMSFEEVPPAFQEMLQVHRDFIPNFSGFLHNRGA